MKIAAFIYAGSLTQLAFEPIAGGKSAYERCLSFIGGLPGLERVTVAEGKLSLPDARPPVAADRFVRVRKEAWSVDLLLAEMEKAGEGMDALLFAWADEPFLDPALAAKMLEDFRRYRAEYGFADGYPLGLTAEILAPRILPAIRKLAAGQSGSQGAPQGATAEIGRGWLFAAIQKDINAFDIETDISPLDLRDLRLSLSCDTKRNRLLVERLAAAGVSDAPSALEVIPENLGLLRTLPAFVQVQVVEGCPQACKLCPYPVFGGDILAKRGFMKREAFAGLLDQVVELSGDAVIDISLWGEPSLHPNIGELIGDVLARPSLSLIVETSGLGWKPGQVEAIAAAQATPAGAASPGRLDWVVSLDAWSPELYAQLRGEGCREAAGFAERLIGLFPGRAHVQMVRTRENEVELEAFWRGWKQKTEAVIVQKYSRQAGLLPERKVSDLSPLARRPCWHLKRDLSVLLDGTVPLCRDCSQLAVGGDLALGNAFEAKGGRPAGLAAAWAAGAAYHERHIEACRQTQRDDEGGPADASSSFPAPCEACDEYYTYNA
jgi:spiro-SPASM protein